MKEVSDSERTGVLAWQTEADKRLSEIRSRYRIEFDGRSYFVMRKNRV